MNEVRWELKNKKTGKLYWLTDKEFEDLKRLGLASRYLVTEIKPLHTIKDPLQFEIKKSISKKGDKRRE